MSSLFPFPHNVPKSCDLERDNMRFSYQYFLTAWTVSTQSVIGSFSEIIWADTSSLAYSGPSFESPVSIQPENLIKLWKSSNLSDISSHLFKLAWNYWKYSKVVGKMSQQLSNTKREEYDFVLLKHQVKKKKIEKKIQNNYLKYNYV